MSYRQNNRLRLFQQLLFAFTDDERTVNFAQCVQLFLVVVVKTHLRTVALRQWQAFCEARAHVSAANNAYHETEWNLITVHGSSQFSSDEFGSVPNSLPPSERRMYYLLRFLPKPFPVRLLRGASIQYVRQLLTTRYVSTKSAIVIANATTKGCVSPYWYLLPSGTLHGFSKFIPNIWHRIAAHPAERLIAFSLILSVLMKLQILLNFRSSRLKLVCICFSSRSRSLHKVYNLA